MVAMTKEAQMQANGGGTVVVRCARCRAPYSFISLEAARSFVQTHLMRTGGVRGGHVSKIYIGKFVL